MCAGKTSKEEYLERIEQIKALLAGKTDRLRADLNRAMEGAVRELQFEKAAEYRDALQAITRLEEEQRIIDFDPEVRDYIGYAARDELSAFVIFHMRAGKLVGSNVFHAEMAGEELENILEFITQYYGSAGKPPRELYTSAAVGDLAVLQRYFAEELASEVTIRTPQTSRDASVLRLCTQNALEELERRLRERGDLPALEELAAVLGLPHPPLRIEGYDIAHIGGKHTVASLVSFANGVPDKGEYKRYRMKSLPEGRIDDFASMREVIARRYTRVKNERLPRPDLILIDGGKGQVNAAQEILDALDLPYRSSGSPNATKSSFYPAAARRSSFPKGRRRCACSNTYATRRTALPRPIAPGSKSGMS